MANDLQVGVGASANDGTGDTMRAAFQKYNAHNHPDLAITGIKASDTAITHSASGAVTLDLNSGVNSYFDINITGASANITGFTISEAATVGVGFLTVRIVNSSGSTRTIAWSGLLWTNGITPSTSLANGAVLVFSAQSWNNGSTWYASLFGRDFT